MLIGAGGIACDAHLPAYAKAGFPVAGVYDLDPERARVAAARFSIPRVYASLEEAATAATPDSVFDVAVPAPAFLDVLPRLPPGSAVLMQKPMGENLEEARAIRELCRERRFLAAVNFQLRHAPCILAARSLIEQGAIGRLYDMEVRVCVYTPWGLFPYLKRLPRVEILYHSVHYIDLIRSFLGEPRSVYAKTVKSPRVPELASTRSRIILDYGPELSAGISANHDHEFGRRNQDSYVKWEGTRGAIKATLGVLLDYPRGEADTFEYCAAGNGACEWTSVPLEGRWFPDAFIGTMASLMRFAEGSAAELPASFEDAFRTMAVVEAAYQSSERGGTAVPMD